MVPFNPPDNPRDRALPRMLRLRSALLKFGALLTIVACPVMALGGSNGDRCRVPDTREHCIETPSDYKHVWDSYHVRCVEPSLYVTAPSTFPADNFLYPEPFAYAWANGSTNLEKYLELRCRFRDSVKARIGIQSYIGFPVAIKATDLPISGDFDLFVYQLPEGEKPRVPSFETWFKLLEDEFGLTYPLEAQKKLVQTYSGIRAFRRAPPRKQVDFIDLFTKLTGCKRSPDWRTNTSYTGFPPIPDLAGCNLIYRWARWSAGGVKVPGDAESGPRSTRDCFQMFDEYYHGPRNANAIRAVLELCQDVNALNTGVGLGYNPMPNPFIDKPWRRQTVGEKYTGREFILPNRELSNDERGLTWEVVTIPGDPNPASYDLRRGYGN